MPTIRALLLALLAATAALPASLADTVATQCDPSGQACVHDKTWGEGCLENGAESGADAVDVRSGEVSASGGAWRTCSEGRTTRAAQVGVAFGATGVWLVWRSETDPSGKDNRRIEVGHADLLGGTSSVRWVWWERSCYLLADVDPAVVIPRSFDPGCVAGAPPVAPFWTWGRIIP